LFELDLVRDPFRVFRFLLGTVVTVYATIITLQSLWDWYVWLSGGDRYLGMLRRYLLVQGLRLRFRTFWGDLIICILLGVAFLLLWHAQGIMDGIDHTLGSVAHGPRAH
jgi:hypothetical protein